MLANKRKVNQLANMYLRWRDMLRNYNVLVTSQDLSVSLILNGLASDFVGFVINYNIHNMGKIIGALHALLIEYEKSLPKKDATPQVMAIQGGRIQKANKKSQKAKGKCKGKGNGKDKSYIPEPKNPKPSAKEHLTKNDACHHCKEEHMAWQTDNCIMKEGMPTLRGRKSVPGMNSSEREWKEGTTPPSRELHDK
nr:hypothetical protein [Tanacetum cinerariifolium]